MLNNKNGCSKTRGQIARGCSRKESPIIQGADTAAKLVDVINNVSASLAIQMIRGMSWIPHSSVDAIFKIIASMPIDSHAYLKLTYYFNA